MTSKRETILQYIATALAATAGVSGSVFRSREDAVTRAESPALIIEGVQDTSDYNTMDYIEWNLQFRATVITRGAGPDTLADSIVNSLYAILMADRTLGGLCFDIVPAGIYFKLAVGDSPVGVTDCLFNVRHRTSSASLEA